MKIQTMSVVVGTTACNASCGYCIAKTTPKVGMLPSLDEINWRNFGIAVKLAKESGVTTILLTGKGEPTLYPDYVGIYLYELKDFPFKELQTNGIALESQITDEELQRWYDLGLTTICLSMAHYDSSKNAEIFQPHLAGASGQMNLEAVIERMLKFKFMVRLTAVGLEGYIGDSIELVKFIQFGKKVGAKQLTYRPMTAPDNTDNETTQWIAQHHLDTKTIEDMGHFVANMGKPVLELAHGAIVYDIAGQNFCWSNCLTTDKDMENMRSLIVYPDGTISYNWAYQGGILLG